LVKNIKKNNLLFLHLVIGLRLINKTKWNTKDLRKLIIKVLEHEGLSKKRTIEIVYSKQRKYYLPKYTGIASLYRNWLRIRVPKPIVKHWKMSNDGKIIETEIEYKFDVQKFTKILIHELSHNQGLIHKEMLKLNDIDVSFIENYKVGVKNERITKSKI